MNTCMWRIVADNDLIKHIEKEGFKTFYSEHPCLRCDGFDTDCNDFQELLVELTPRNYGMVEKFEQRYKYTQ